MSNADQLPVVGETGVEYGRRGEGSQRSGGRTATHSHTLVPFSEDQHQGEPTHSHTLVLSSEDQYQGGPLNPLLHSGSLL